MGWGESETNNWKTPNKQNPTTHNWGCCESVPELSWPRHWALSVRLTIPSPVDSADRCVPGRWLRFGCPLLLPPTRFASHRTWVLEGAFGKVATGVFKICEAGNTKVLRCSWCNLKIFCIYAFAILIWNEVTEMKWFSAEAGEAVGVVEKMNEVYSEQTDTFKPGAQYKLMPWVYCTYLETFTTYWYHDIKTAESLEGRLFQIISWQYWIPGTETAAAVSTTWLCAGWGCCQALLWGRGRKVWDLSEKKVSS